MVPTLVEVHVTPLVEPFTVAVNVCICPVVRETVVGEIVTLIVDATRLPTRYVASMATADEEWPTLLNAVVASAPQ
jgi:hypothetical protein